MIRDYFFENIFAQIFNLCIRVSLVYNSFASHKVIQKTKKKKKKTPHLMSLVSLKFLNQIHSWKGLTINFLSSLEIARYTCAKRQEKTVQERKEHKTHFTFQLFFFSLVNFNLLSHSFKFRRRCRETLRLNLKARRRNSSSTQLQVNNLHEVVVKGYFD